MSWNNGHYSRPKYDNCAYPDSLSQSTGPYAYIMNTDARHNCNGCLSTFGPVSGFMGAGVSSQTGDVVAAAQENIDVDTIMSNRNVPISKCKRGKVNPISLDEIKTVNTQVCDDLLNIQHSRLTDPAMFYRDSAINRFYDLPKDPQANIFYDFPVSSKQQAKDNFVPEISLP